MEIYGIDKVRGGSYSQIELSKFQIECLEKEISHAQGKCFRCGRFGHFAKNCFAKTKFSGENLQTFQQENNLISLLSKLIMIIIIMIFYSLLVFEPGNLFDKSYKSK